MLAQNQQGLNDFAQFQAKDTEAREGQRAGNCGNITQGVERVSSGCQFQIIAAEGEGKEKRAGPDHCVDKRVSKNIGIEWLALQEISNQEERKNSQHDIQRKRQPL